MTVPSWATCLMSALESAAPLKAAAGAGGDRTIFSWEQSVPMPSYLIAVAVGELESLDISSRCADIADEYSFICVLFPISEQQTKRFCTSVSCQLPATSNFITDLYCCCIFFLAS